MQRLRLRRVTVILLIRILESRDESSPLFRCQGRWTASNCPTTSGIAGPCKADPPLRRSHRRGEPLPGGSRFFSKPYDELSITKAMAHLLSSEHPLHGQAPLLKKFVMLRTCRTTFNPGASSSLCPLVQPQTPSRAAGSFTGPEPAFIQAKSMSLGAKLRHNSVGSDPF